MNNEKSNSECKCLKKLGEQENIILCCWPLCETEEYQQCLADIIEKQLISGLSD